MDKEDVVPITQTHNGILFSRLKKKRKKNENLPFATWMDLENTMLSEVKSDKERRTPHVFTYMQNLKNKMKATKQKQRPN